MILPLLLAALAPQAAVGPVETRVDKYRRCATLRDRDPAEAVTYAKAWQARGADRLALRCQARAEAARSDWKAAAAIFERAAALPDARRDDDTPALWTEAGNAWLAGGEPVRAVAAFDAAAGGALSSFDRGELQLDRARALVAAGDAGGARTAIDSALILVPADPLAWLLSATLARRGGDLPRARKDIAEAVRRAPDDASVQLEAGNVAALARDEAGARSAWAEAARLGGERPAGVQARAALAQFAGGDPTSPR